jgi:hypothetical protein
MIAPWAQEELATMDLGDERLDARFELLLSALGSRPNRSILAPYGGRAEMKGAYRFFDNDKVTFRKVLQPPETRPWCIWPSRTSCCSCKIPPRTT